jgi:hypothetical protein
MVRYRHDVMFSCDTLKFVYLLIELYINFTHRSATPSTARLSLLQKLSV